MQPTRVRARIEMQGFVGLSDRTLTEIDYWLRLAPFLCAAWTGVGTALGSAEILWALVPIAALGAILPMHPFDAIYNYAVRHLLGSAPIPRYRAPRRFASVGATVWLLAAGWAFDAGAQTLGRLLGAAMVVLASVPVLTGFCVPSFIYRRLFGWRGLPAPGVAERS